MTSFYGSSCANNAKDALNTPDCFIVLDDEEEQEEEAEVAESVRRRRRAEFESKTEAEKKEAGME
eukprot:8409872-Pyramimonas_sp.AAC.1